MMRLQGLQLLLAVVYKEVIKENKMIKILTSFLSIVLFTICISGLVLGDPTIHLSRFVWTNSGEMLDNSIIQPGEIQSANIYCGNNSGNYTSTFIITDASLLVPNARVEETFANLAMPDGIYYCALTITHINGNEGGYSNEVGPLDIRGGLMQANAPGVVEDFGVR